VSVDRANNIIASFERGALTEVMACALLIDLAGASGTDAIIPALSPKFRSSLKHHPLVSDPPTKPEDIFIIESSCGREEAAPVELRREIAYRGAWALHRALWGARD
jgi:hypothetical protein